MNCDMNKLPSALLLLIISIAPLKLFADTVDEKNEWSGAEFRRWSAVVSDMDETIHLYRDILGFSLDSVRVDPLQSYVYTIFNIDRSIRTKHATFSSSTKQRVLSVIEVPGVKLERPPQSPRLSVALINANGGFDKIVAQLKAEKYEVFEPHRLGSKGIEIGFLDRDGHLYALLLY